MSEDSGEKTFAPTQKRIQDAAKKGDVLRSRELATAAVMAVGAAWLKFAGPWLLGDLSDALRAGFTWDRAAIDAFAPGRMMLYLLGLALPPVLVLGVIVSGSSLASQLSFGEGRWIGGDPMATGSPGKPPSAPQT